MINKELLSVLRNQLMQTRFGPLELIIFNTVLMGNHSLHFSHKHDYFELHLVLQGDAVFVVDGEAVIVNTGQLCCIAPGTERYVESNPFHEMLHFVVHFDLVESVCESKYNVSQLTDFRQFLSSIYLKKVWVCNDDNRCAAIYNLICKELELHQFGFMLKIQNFLSSFIISAIQSIGVQGMLYIEPKTHGGSNLACDVVSYIRSHYTQGISLADAAKELNVSPRHITRVLRETFDTTFYKVLVSYQIENAKTLLCCTQLTLEQIAEQVGFSCAGVLRENFFKYTDQAIGEYRKHVKMQCKTVVNHFKDDG